MSPVEHIKHPLFEQYGLEVLVKRDDLIHPVISGNKWRKLKYNLNEAKKQGYKGVLSFGGAYSNHVHALAFACHQQGLLSKAIIRGEKAYANNFTLSCAAKWGMTLNFVDRKTYKRRADRDYLNDLQRQHPSYWIVPEGGTNHLALKGVSEICQELESQADFDVMITPVGSAGTLAGLALGDKNKHKIIGIAVLKQAEYLTSEINSLLADYQVEHKNWQLKTEFHGGGYARFTDKDVNTLLAFKNRTLLPIEPIYSGKMILALLSMITQGYFKRGTRIMLLHTGGLQGLAGLVESGRLKADEWPLPPEIQAL